MRIKMILLTSIILLCVANTASNAAIRKSSFRGLDSLEIENKALKLVVLPQRGANIISIVDKRNGREWVWQNPTFKYRPLAYATGFPDGDMSGFDDCFPSVGECDYPEGPWKGITMPDHGETWTLPYEFTRKGSAVRFKTHGIRLPYIFEKEIAIVEPDRISIRYKVTNPTSEPMLTTWAAHFLVKTQPGMQIFLPKNTKICDGIPGWNVVTENNLDWIELTGPETKQATKRYTEKLSSGYGGFYDPRTTDFLALVFSTRDLPYFGIWINQAGYPANEIHYNAALEPTDGDETYELNEKKGIKNYIPARSSVKWELSLIVGQADKSRLYTKMSEYER